MPDRYEPKSKFLKNFDFETVPLSGHEFGKSNLRRLISLMKDPDSSNRDWATYYLSASDIVEEEVVEALIERTEDSHAETRSEALLGLAKRKHPKALELLFQCLRGNSIGLLELEAAGSLADPALLPILEELYSTWHLEPEGDDHVKLIKQAISSCRDGDAEKHGFMVVQKNST